MPIITLLTDFGQQDGFVGTMKGVILGICPNASIVDISHDISPQDVDEAAFVLRNAYTYFPEQTIHVVVVDPGVGSDRRAVIVEVPGHTFVGPDNGVFSPVYHHESDPVVTEITNRAYMLPEISRTFHGRDIFAPAAAHLAAGVKSEAFGDRISDFIPGNATVPVLHENRIGGQIQHIDHFGNIITNIPESMFTDVTDGKTFVIRTGAYGFDRVCTSYADAAAGEPLAILSSAGFLEVAVNGGNAAERLGVKRGDRVEVAVSGQK